MIQSQSEDQTVELYVENIGGITETTVEFTPGVTILTGRNATNRTSLLQALMAVLGSDDVSLRANAERGRVELTIGTTTYTRTIRRENGTLVTDGDPYLDDATLADLFAFLLESNEARRAVSRGADLRDIIMRPIDTEEIESKISALQDEREKIDAELEEIEECRDRLPALEERRSDLESEISAKRAELSDIEDRIADEDEAAQTRLEQEEELESKLSELKDYRGELEDLRHRIESQRDSINALEETRGEIESELENTEGVPDGRVAELEDEIEELHARRNELDDTIERLQSVIQFNQDLLEGDLDFVAELAPESEGTSSVTDRLVEDEPTLRCWTCGSDVHTNQIESMLDRFRDLHSRRLEKRSSLDDEIDELRAKREALEERKRRKEQLRTRLDRIEGERSDREDELARLETRRDDLISEIERLESEVEHLRSEHDHGDLIDLHKEANRLEVKIERLESDREEVTAEIRSLEDRIAERDQLRTQRSEVQSEIEDLRTKIDRVERSAVEEFNDQMEAVLDALEYDNLERIWLERTECEEEERTKTTTQFELHVVRSTDEDAVYEDDVDHLSESEREVTGLVFALAGYLAHDLHEELPVMLLDSVEAIDPPRIEALIEHFTDYTDHFVAALLQDDARVLDDAHQRITEI